MSTQWNNNDQQRLQRGLHALAQSAPPYETPDQPVHDVRTWRTWRCSAALPAFATLTIMAAAAALPMVIDEAERSRDASRGQYSERAENDPASPSTFIGIPDTLVESVRQAAEPMAALVNEDGFGRVVLDFDAGTVTVYWKGRPPEQVVASLGTTSTGVTVELVDVPFSQAELAAAGRRILTATRAGSELPAAHVARPRPDLSGIVVEMERAALKSGQLAEIERLAGVPVTVVSGESLDLQ